MDGSLSAASPSGEEETARAHLAACVGAERAAGAQLTRLGGLTNCVFKVGLSGETLCLRLPGRGSASFVDRQREAHNARAAAAAGVAPDILHFGDDGTMLTRFIAGDPLNPARLGEHPDALPRAAAALRRLDAAGEVWCIGRERSELRASHER